MQLPQIYLSIEPTGPAQWNSLTFGPMFHQNLSASSSSQGGSVVRVTEHGTRAVLNDDVDISIEFGMDAATIQIDALLDWVKPANFEYDNARPFFVDLFYRGNLVDRVIAVWIDQYRAALPLPYSVTADGGVPGAVPTWHVSRRSFLLVRLIDQLRGGLEFDRYFALSGLSLDRA
ncbi:hypothetical protein [Agreia sp. VKM Ac-1783]|uniref:hypothetical protein n=1 Tax=Agreia sp. VKM Ac-1783 TaxID=1938889 RepID=UPI000A2AB88E|nr:hypothetical protein [Agreia sp. VKM Ac-1783]SMQ75051.1 hypothetical protein SAMN06295943_3452 [Agreia sp. VKM Ac-1783]